jgi:hypothetical protein
LPRNAALIDGLVLDATWKIIRSYVASILILSTSNAGIPVALAMEHFRKIKEIEAYVQEHFQVFALGFPVFVFGSISEGIDNSLQVKHIV